MATLINQEQLKVLVYSANSNIGGVQIWCFSYFRYLLENNVPATLFIGQSGDLVEDLSEFHRSQLIVGDLATLFTYLSNNHIDILHVPSQSIDEGLGFVKILFPRIKIVVTCHGSIPIGWSTNNCDQIISCAPWLTNAASSIVGHEIPYIFNGVNSQNFYYEEDNIATIKPIILWVGRVNDTVKCFKSFIAAIPQIKDLGFDIWVATSVKKSDCVYNIDVEIDEWFSSNYFDMPKLYRTVSNSGGALLMTSIREGLPLTAIEAQACGCPLIGPCHTGIKDAAINKNFLYESNEIDDMLNKIKQLLQKKDYKTKAELSKAALNHFDMHNMTLNYFNLYKANKAPLKSNIIGQLKRKFLQIKYENLSFRLGIFKNISNTINDLDNLDLCSKLYKRKYIYLLFNFYKR
jgi:glycosyltransferase involved in cell wall biosynthesis